MKTLTRSLACLIVAGSATVVAFGCGKKSKPATKPAPMTATTKPAVTAAAPAVKIDPKDATHDTTADSPLFAAIPSDAAAKPTTTLKKGEKLVVLVPGRKYSQVTTLAGMKGYVLTASLKPLGS